MINSCIEHDNPNGGPPVESEIIVGRSGLVPIPVSGIGVDVPFNGFGDENADLGVRQNGTEFPCRFKEPTVRELPGCTTVLPLGPNDEIPPDAFVVIFVNGITVTEDVAMTDFSNLCDDGKTVVILQSACNRTAGAFANQSGVGSSERFTNLISPCADFSFSYNTNLIDPDNGTFYLVGLNQPGNLDCDFPVIPETCPPLDTSVTICNYEPGTSAPISTSTFDVLYPPSILTVSYHPSPGAAETGTQQITDYAAPSTDPDILFVRLTYAENLCVTVGRLRIRFSGEGAVTMTPTGPALGCDEDEDGTGTFNLRLLDAEIGAGEPVQYFTDAAGTMGIATPEDYQSGPATIFAAAGLGECRGNLVPLELALTTGPEVTVATNPASCSSSSDGLIDYSVTGSGPFDFDWARSAFDGLARVDTLAVGNYRISITDAWGCREVLTSSVGTGPDPSLACQLVRAATDLGTSDGAVGFTITDATPPFTISYTFQGANAGARVVAGSTAEFNNLPAGDYVFRVADAVGCTTESCSLTIPAGTPLSLECSLRNNANGSNVRGAINLSLSGGQPPYQLRLVRAQGGSDIVRTNLGEGDRIEEDLRAGDYTITLADAAGEMTTCMTTIAVVACPLVIVDTLLSTLCNLTVNNSFLSFTVAGVPQGGSISRTWTGPGAAAFNGQSDAGPLMPGTYTFTVTDENGCTATSGPIEVMDAQRATFANDAPRLDTINCTVFGAIDVTPTAGNGPFTVRLLADDFMTVLREDGPALLGAPFTLSGFSAGPDRQNYAVQLVDASGCAGLIRPFAIEGGGTLALTLPPSDQLITPPTCGGGTDGTLSLAAAGGASPYAYRWLSAPPLAPGRTLAPGNAQVDLPAGSYSVEITDASGCQDTVTVILPEPSSPLLSCAGTMDVSETTFGAARFLLDGGTAPYTISLTRAGITTDYPNQPTVAGASETTLTPLDPGVYEAVLTDANGCRSESCTFTINGPACTFSATAATDSLPCGDGGEVAIVVTPTGGQAPYNFSWSADPMNATDSLPVVMQGRYDVLITDANSCELDTFFEVGRSLIPPLLMTENPVHRPFCPGDSVRIPLLFDGPGPYELTYAVDEANVTGGEQTFSTAGPLDTLRLLLPTSGGEPYTLRLIRLTNTNNCTVDVARSFLIAPSLQDTLRRNETLCLNQTVQIGGRTFSASMPADTFTVAEGTACPVRYEVNLQFNDSGSARDTLREDWCAGVDYSLNGEIFNDSRPEGAVVFQRQGECDSLVYVVLNILPVPTGTLQERVCAGTPVVIGNTPFDENSPSGTVRLVGQAASGCDSLVMVDLDFFTPAPVTLSGSPGACPGDSVDLTIAYSGSELLDVILQDMMGNQLAFTNLVPGQPLRLAATGTTTYSISSAAADGCAAPVAGSATVTVSDLMAAAGLVVDPADFCVDTLGAARVNAQGGIAPLTIRWSNGATEATVTGLDAGIFRVTVTDDAGCTLTDSVRVVDADALAVSLNGVAPDCPGGSGGIEVVSVAGGIPPYELSLDGSYYVPITGMTTAGITPQVGENRTWIRDAVGCTVETTVFVPPALRLDVALVQDTTIMLGDSLLLDPGLLPLLDSAWWTPTTGLRTPASAATWALPPSSTTYALHLRTVAQCLFRYQVSITVDERRFFYAPTVFSPNGDEVNDRYELGLSPAVAGLESFTVYNRWGTLVYQGTTPWDGSMTNGVDAPAAVYVFKGTVRMIDGSRRALSGDFILMR